MKIRITPAWAGKSLMSGMSTGCQQDHPRVGGEKSVRLFCIPSRLGSPPRGRGKDECKCQALFENRITPAWAGKSGNVDLNVTTVKDHPRVGGEKTSSPAALALR